jgi:hypothetical protein
MSLGVEIMFGVAIAGMIADAFSGSNSFSRKFL